PRSLCYPAQRNRVGGNHCCRLEPLVEGAELRRAPRDHRLWRWACRSEGGGNYDRLPPMLRESRIQTVVLTVQYSTRSSYYINWLDAFRFASQFVARAFNVFKRSQRRAAAAAIERAELIVALHACSADTLDYIKPLSGALNSRRGKLLMLVGNEYNLPW